MARSESAETATLKVRVQPRASRNEVVGVRDGVLWLRLTSPPVEGAANQACVEFVAQVLGLKRSQVKLASGLKSRDKVLTVAGMSQAQLDALVAAVPAKGSG